MRIEKLAAMLLAGSGILFSSCNDRIETENPTASEVWENEIRAELTGVGDIQTRSHNVYMYEVRWDAGDQIYVKDANGQHAKFTLADGENTTNGVFRQNSDETATLSGAIEAFSPAEIGATMEWPSVMTGNAETPMYSSKAARSDGDETLKFRSLGSVVNLVFNSQTQGATLQSITLSADQPLSGAFTVDAEGKAVLANDANGTVTLDLSAGGKPLTSPAAYSFYLYVPSGDYTNLTATFNAIGHKPYACNFGSKTLHHNAVEKFSVAGRFYPNIYTVTFDTRGYGKNPESQQIEYSGLVTEPIPPVAGSEVLFGGWYKDAERTVPWDFSSDRVTGDITLYARWYMERTAYKFIEYSDADDSDNMGNLIENGQVTIKNTIVVTRHVENFGFIGTYINNTLHFEASEDTYLTFSIVGGKEIIRMEFPIDGNPTKPYQYQDPSLNNDGWFIASGSNGNHDYPCWQGRATEVNLKAEINYVRYCRIEYVDGTIDL